MHKIFIDYSNKEEPIIDFDDTPEDAVNTLTTALATLALHTVRVGEAELPTMTAFALKQRIIGDIRRRTKRVIDIIENSRTTEDLLADLKEQIYKGEGDQLNSKYVRQNDNIHNIIDEERSDNNEILSTDDSQ